MTGSLGQWAAIDIETTGVDPAYDSIIDVGFLQFEGLKLVRKYSSLVRYDGQLSQFIQKLTSITPEMLMKAPAWREVEVEIGHLFGHHLLAHNANFERSFLKEHFDKIDDGSDRESYEDSLYFLGLLFPEYKSLKLEHYICHWGLADKEEHRGFSDALDLLKVLLVACELAHNDREKWHILESLFRKYQFNDYWYYKLFSLSQEERKQLAGEIDFDLEGAFKKALEADNEVSEKEEIPSPAFEFSFSGENIKSIYHSDEKIKERLPFFKYRKSQEDLSLKIGQCFKNGVHALVQAPTGTGKTLGYLLPSSLFALEEDQQVLIATGTKTLQHQAMNKDIPLLRKMLGLHENELVIKQLVGSNNHLCELLFRKNDGEEDLLTGVGSFEERFTKMYFEVLFYHNSKAQKPLLRGDVPFVFKRNLDDFESKERELAVDFRSCTGSQCPFKGNCSYIRGLKEAKDADIIVGNHALMFSWPKGIPRPAHIVVDEAHKIENETTRAFSLEASQEVLEQFQKSLQNLQGVGSLFYLLANNEHSEGANSPEIKKLREDFLKQAGMLKDNLIELPDIIETYFKKMPRYTEKYWNETPMISESSATDSLRKKILNRFESIRHILNATYELVLPYMGRWEPQKLKEEGQIVALTRFESFVGVLEDILVAVSASLDQKEGYTHSLKYQERSGFALLSSPIDIGRVLHDGLLETSSSVVFTSATLGNASGDTGTKGIEWATGYSYLDPKRRFKSGFYLPSVYNYKENTKVFLCDDTLPFYDSNFVEETLKRINKLVRNIGGRSLFLFSAKTRFEVAREVLLKEFDGEIPLFIQGMGNNVVEDFQNSGSGILLGMESFGEGIDIPGEALQFVFIDKVPDLRMDLVIQDRRDFYQSSLGNEFTDYYLAHRTRSLQQKLGRLLRTESDHGGVIIVDSRVRKWKGKTMEKLVRLMEPYKLKRAPLEEACLEVESFIKKEPLN